MSMSQSQPRGSRRALILHTALALPWLAEAVAILLLAFTGDAQGPLQLAAVPAAATGVALLLTRRWWLVGSAVVGSIAGFFGVVGIGLNYIDHTPGSATAKFALDATWATFIAGLVAALAAIVVGVLEWRAGRRVPSG